MRAVSPPSDQQVFPAPDQDDDMYGWTPDPQRPRRPAAESSGGGQYRHYKEEVVDSILTRGSGGSGGGTTQQKRRPTAHITASPLFSAPPMMCAWAIPSSPLVPPLVTASSYYPHPIHKQGLLAPVAVRVQEYCATKEGKLNSRGYLCQPVFVLWWVWTANIAGRAQGRGGVP